ncbi:toxin-antitoxin system YwqK family antitoxin [Aquimarina sp. RZ0]|uniref:toxin-antitoxin system YwqK family antitoxin n=1 Tax=Aquimarina sp. RZ0 TaxID=2607730 RepID=UPI0011F1AEC7|nr:hypothetical protein [Aquimarina sp. RZ0]KAA1243974.1 hypothetical protein F0000_18655 [Aquimarina sp. RZ0]
MRTLSFLLFLFFISSCKEETVTYEIKNICNKEVKKNSKHGYTKNYFANAINIESIGHYKNGIQDGFWKYFYRNGKIKAEGHYKNGKKQGFWKEYHKNGTIKSEGHIDDCKPSGYWKFYDQRNNLIKEINY